MGRHKRILSTEQCELFNRLEITPDDLLSTNNTPILVPTLVAPISSSPVPSSVIASRVTVPDLANPIIPVPSRPVRRRRKQRRSKQDNRAKRLNCFVHIPFALADRMEVSKDVNGRQAEHLCRVCRRAIIACQCQDKDSTASCGECGGTGWVLQYR